MSGFTRVAYKVRRDKWVIGVYVKRKVGRKRIIIGNGLEMQVRKGKRLIARNI